MSTNLIFSNKTFGIYKTSDKEGNIYTAVRVSDNSLIDADRILYSLLSVLFFNGFITFEESLSIGDKDKYGESVES